MPKSSSPSSKLPKSFSEPSDPNLLRKKKNADAQAAFRARRQNYISTLEETVTSLESVVIQLQESCRETRNENLELRQENSRLRYESREREKYWKAFVHARKSSDHSFPGPSTLFPPYSQSYDNTSFVDQHTPSVAFTNHDHVDGSSVPPDRAGKYPAYPYSIPDSPRDTRWQLPPALPPALSATEVTPQSPSYIQSPSLTAPTDLAAAYPTRFPTNDRKVALDAVLSTAPYGFPGASSSGSSSRYQNHIPDASIPNSRSMSPTTSASSATSLPLTSSYQLPFHDPSTAQDITDFEYRGQSLPHCPDVPLHGAIADITLAGQHSARYRFGTTRRSDSDADNQDHHISMLPPNDSCPQHEDNTTRLRGNRRNIAHPYRRSQSPGPTPLLSTVAVIKAQAFGALRRTRAKTKRATDSAARVAQDVLEARGIGVGPMPSPKHDQHQLYEGDDDVGKQ